MQRAVLWVDDKGAADLLLPSSPLQQTCTKAGVKLVGLNSAKLVREWLAAQASQYSAETVRVVTNRYRAEDGGDAAAERLIAWLRGEPAWRDCNVLVFCTDPNKVAHLRDASTAVSKDPVAAVKFAAFEKMDGIR